ncbi:hypothetical protein Esti_003606 [Eimeria stiedai]
MAPNDSHKIAFRTFMGQFEWPIMPHGLAKRKFAAQFTEYLGYRAGDDDIHPSTQKVSAVALWPPDVTNETEVRQFLGTISNCHNFAGPEFAILPRRLQQLLKKKASIELVRGLDFLADFQHFSIVYQPAATNMVPKALSRCPVSEQDLL